MVSGWRGKLKALQIPQDPLPDTVPYLPENSASLVLAPLGLSRIGKAQVNPMSVPYPDGAILCRIIAEGDDHIISGIR